MLRTRLLSTSTFRLTLLYLGVFSLSAVALLMGVYFLSARFMERQTLETIAGDVADLRDEASQHGILALGQTIAQRAASEPDRHSIYLLTDPSGSNRLAGNLERLPQDPVITDDIWRFSVEVRKRGPNRGDEAEEPHQAIAKLVSLRGGLLLLVGRDIEDKVHTQRLLRLAISLGGCAMLVLGLIGGYVLSRWMLHRLDVVNRTTAQIMAGDLARRIKVRGVDDEFDELGRNLNAMLERIERLLTGMRQVTDDIAHDLRTPLNRLRSRIEVALMGELESGETRELLEATLHDADGLIETFNALLNIARAETGALRSDYERFDLTEVGRDLFEMYEPLAEEKGITLTMDAHGPVMVEGHRQLVAQAIANLTDNAVKYTPAPGHVVVRTSAQPTPSISVEDDGPGIPAEERERAKDRFVRLDATRSTPGSGLGLSLVDAVATLHEARFELGDNAPGLKARLAFKAALASAGGESLLAEPAPLSGMTAAGS